MEIELANQLADHVPVIAVITKSRSDMGFRAKVQELIPSVRNVVRVRALEENLDDGHVFKLLVLEYLVELTNEVVPEAQRGAFIAAQKVSFDKKHSATTKVIVASATTAAGVAITPIPFADALVLVPIQIAMLGGISVAYGLSADRAMLGTVLSGTATGIFGPIGGKALAGDLLKLIPGVGIAAGLVQASVASAVTTAFGTSYLTTL